jgi:hypothetical protein
MPVPFALNLTPDENYDPYELAEGVRVEHEHTKGAPPELAGVIAKSIAKDHLDEYPDYYSRLLNMEAKAAAFWGKRESN